MTVRPWAKARGTRIVLLLFEAQLLDTHVDRIRGYSIGCQDDGDIAATREAERKRADIDFVLAGELTLCAREEHRHAHAADCH